MPKTIFADPVSCTIARSLIEVSLVVVDSRLIAGNGSRVRCKKDGAIKTSHPAHPTKEAKRYRILVARVYAQHHSKYTLDKTSGTK